MFNCSEIGLAHPRSCFVRFALAVFPVFPMLLSCTPMCYVARTYARKLFILLCYHRTSIFSLTMVINLSSLRDAFDLDDRSITWGQSLQA